MTICVFCEIAGGRARASIVYADDRVLAFMDIQPVNPGHVLVIPHTHAAGLAELDREVGQQVFSVGMDLAAAVRRSGLRCEGVNLFLADGAAAGQEVGHVHLHVLPRFRGDGFGLHFGPDYAQRPERSALDQVAAALREALEDVQHGH
jgi:histidine triad (HIT) family protein